jgi:outer membrane protein assembly factor BamE (lipoprotein component of BamABCDE complex)
MAHFMRYLILVSLPILFIVLFVCTKGISQDKGVLNMTNDEFNQRIPLVKKGMTEKEVLNILGSPHNKENNKWFYNKFEGEMRPPNVGEQRFYGATLYFEKGLVKEIYLSWIDATGPKK